MMNEVRKTMLESIKEAMTNGQLDWSRPWNVPGEPVNAVTGKEYNGINVIFLWLAGMKLGTNDQRWCTFNQAKGKKWTVKKGSKGTKVVYWNVLKTEGVDKDGNKVEEAKPYTKVFTVFNATQIEGIAPIEKRESIKTNERAESILANCGVRINYGGSEALYSKTGDYISLPERSEFKSDAHFYATALHEIAHSTGHATRLKRDMSGHFGSENYAFEELVVEIASAFVFADLGLEVSDKEMSEHIKMHAAYLTSWNKRIHDDAKTLEAAISQATKAANLIMSYCTVAKETAEPEGDSKASLAA